MERSLYTSELVWPSTTIDSDLELHRTQMIHSMLTMTMMTDDDCKAGRPHHGSKYLLEQAMDGRNTHCGIISS